MQSVCVLTELEKLRGHFQLLSVLPVDTRSSLFQLLKTTMEDKEAVSVLESVVSEAYRNRAQTHTVLQLFSMSGLLARIISFLKMLNILTSHYVRSVIIIIYHSILNIFCLEPSSHLPDTLIQRDLQSVHSTKFSRKKQTTHLTYSF